VDTSHLRKQAKKGTGGDDEAMPEWIAEALQVRISGKSMLELFLVLPVELDVHIVGKGYNSDRSESCR
jgi:hypothetical protein